MRCWRQSVGLSVNRITASATGESSCLLTISVTLHKLTVRTEQNSIDHYGTALTAETLIERPTSSFYVQNVPGSWNDVPSPATFPSAALWLAFSRNLPAATCSLNVHVAFSSVLWGCNCVFGLSVYGVIGSSRPHHNDRNKMTSVSRFRRKKAMNEIGCNDVTKVTRYNGIKDRLSTSSCRVFIIHASV